MKKIHPITQILMGDPFVTATDNFSAAPASISGTASFSDGCPLPGAKIFAYAGERVMGLATTDGEGAYLLDYLAAGVYTLVLETRLGEEFVLENRFLLEGEELDDQDFSIDPVKEIAAYNAIWDYLILPESTPPPSDWNQETCDLISWSSGAMPVNEELKFFQEGTEELLIDVPTSVYRSIYLRREFDLESIAHPVYLNISADMGVDIYINGGPLDPADITPEMGLGTSDTRKTLSYWSYKIDITHYLFTSQTNLVL